MIRGVTVWDCLDGSNVEVFEMFGPSGWKGIALLELGALSAGGWITIIDFGL